MTDAASEAASPAQGDPVSAAAAAAAKAPMSSLPSRPISTMPERSDTSPAIAQRMSGVARRAVPSSTARMSIQTSAMGGAPQ